MLLAENRIPNTEYLLPAGQHVQVYISCTFLITGQGQPPHPERL